MAPLIMSGEREVTVRDSKLAARITAREAADLIRSRGTGQGPYLAMPRSGYDVRPLAA